MSIQNSKEQREREKEARSKIHDYKSYEISIYVSIISRSQFSQQFSQQKYPYVLKAGHCHGGVATAKIVDQNALQEAAGLLNGSGLADIQCYCTLEPFIDAKFDVHVQKIGNNYKSFM